MRRELPAGNYSKPREAPPVATVTLADVQAAASAIAGAVVRTPSAVSHTLSEVLGATVVVKFENLQFTAAFKERGARNRLLQLNDDERAAGVVAMSAGNHAQAVAHHARLLGIPATIVMPEGTPFVKVARTRHLGATVELHGGTIAEAAARAEELVAEKGVTYVHPFDDPLVIAGQGTVALELLDDHPDLDAIVVPVGGGGLVAGMAVVSKALAPHVEVVGVQSELYAAMVGTFHDHAVECGGSTMAEGIAVGATGTLTTDARRAARRRRRVRVRAEHRGRRQPLPRDREGRRRGRRCRRPRRADRPSGPLRGTAGRRRPHRRQHRPPPAGVGDHRAASSAAVASPGCASRSTTAPARWPRLTAMVGDAGGNIVEVVHQRLFADIPIRSAEVELAVETLDRAHGERLVVRPSRSRLPGRAWCPSTIPSVL